MTERAFSIRWTQTAVELLDRIPDRKTKSLLVRRVNQLARSPEQQGKPLVGELAGFRSIRAVGQRFRIVYRVDRDEVVISVVAVGRRKAGDRTDVYALAQRLLSLGLLR